MTEPVAYWYVANKNKKENYLEFCISDNKNFTSIPLYTAEQLHPRVKMTKKQYDRLMWHKENTDLFQCLDYFHEHDGNSKFGAVTEEIRADLGPEDIARAWLDEEVVEIIPNMKYFVQKKDFNGDYRFLRINAKDLSFNYTKDKAVCFDTKEQAALWKNPLTEVVLLPVEEDND